MIYCGLSDLKLYAGISKNLKTAFDYILSTDLNYLSLGRTEIQGADIYINKSQLELVDYSSIFEVHHRYIDIHIDLESEDNNRESIISSYKNLEVYRSYIEKDDYELLIPNSSYDISNQQETLLTPGYCAIYFTGEAHKPGLIKKNQSDGEGRNSRQLIKCVVKVLDDTDKLGV